MSLALTLSLLLPLTPPTKPEPGPYQARLLPFLREQYDCPDLVVADALVPLVVVLLLLVTSTTHYYFYQYYYHNY